ncbi:zinc fingers and homeoboxes protein 1 [Octodon degus]|uniref:Zinc fingers and homeoboxes protein 1 n=1 Tax=Octodon degus TaxID=10160 RepID=A0A6P3VC04_OCTDE|nr:zinc fingers and homeoboxes protein 1 [Octodon degus]
MELAGWVIGGEFEDSVFEEGPERRPGPPAPYGAKRCEPQWFDEETESSDDVEILTVKKFRGDLAYRRQEYQKALQEYSTISEKLSHTNFAMRRDVQEGQARCLAHLGRHLEALEIATNLENKATNIDHLTSVLYLQFGICSSWPNLEKTVSCLQKLIAVHPFNPWAWGKLAEAYLSLGPALSASFGSPQGQNSFTSSDRTITSTFPPSGRDCLLCFPETLPESSVFSMETRSSNSQKHEKTLKSIPGCVAEKRGTPLPETQLKACASLIRARLLLQLSQSQQTSFALEKNLRTQQEIEDKMREFHFQEDTLLRIAEDFHLLRMVSMLSTSEAAFMVAPTACSGQRCAHLELPFGESGCGVLRWTVKERSAQLTLRPWCGWR